MTNRIRVALLFGGVSSEHEISCLTAAGVARAIDSTRFEVIGIGITGEGDWVRITAEELAAFEVVDQRLPRVSPDRPRAVLLKTDGGAQLATREEDRLTDFVKVDVAIALLHGPWGEDGTIQGMFEMLGVRYVGAGVAASAICMDKDLMKRAMAAVGLPVGPWECITSAQWRDDADECIERASALGFPLFVKPARGGSSIGIGKVEGPAQLVAAIEEARLHDPKVVVERGFVGAREIEVAVLQNCSGVPRTSVPGEIVMHDPEAFYDFTAKYLPEEQVSLRVPAVLTDTEAAGARALAGSVFDAMGVEGLARVDLFLAADGNWFVNELNTMPGFTEYSMFPQLWQESGVDYRGLISTLIELALERPMGLR